MEEDSDMRCVTCPEHPGLKSHGACVVAGVQPLAEEPAADAKHSHYLPQREEWGKLEGQIEQHPAKRDQHWVG